MRKLRLRINGESQSGSIPSTASFRRVIKLYFAGVLGLAMVRLPHEVGAMGKDGASAIRDELKGKMYALRVATEAMSRRGASIATSFEFLFAVRLIEATTDSIVLIVDGITGDESCDAPAVSNLASNGSDWVRAESTETTRAW